jgi:sigma-B regulation protein RsbU (phosphoserine phosphatase)
MIAESVVVDVSQDWLLACDLQERFMQMPDVDKQRLTSSARCRQMRALGGDCFSVLPLPGRQTGIAVADASGKGLPAALMIANVQSSLRTGALFAPENPAAVVTALNRQLYASSPADRYATLFYAVFDEKTSILQYVNAGHNPAFVMSDSGAVTWLESGAPPVGLFAETLYQARTLRLRSADLIVAYTDGIVEASNPAGEEWGANGLVGAVTRCKSRAPESVIQAAFAALDQFSCDNQTDDATMLVALVS